MVAHALTYPGLHVTVLAPNLRGARDALESGAHRIVAPVSVSMAHSLATAWLQCNRASASWTPRWLAWEAARLPLDFALSTNVGYSIQGYTFSGGYQKVSGDTAYAYVGGTDTYLFSEQQVSTFALANERAWMLRYDYNFAALGIPGLTLNVRYVKGDQVKPQRITSAKGRALAAGDGEGREWERTTDITYVVQSGPLRHVSLRWRNASMRSNFADAADENRVVVGYTFEF